jgi:hypothetical protein
MNRILFSIILINILGLTAIQLLEVWRAGSAAGLISIGGYVCFALATTFAAVLLNRRR